MTKVAPTSLKTSATVRASSSRMPISEGARRPTPWGKRHHMMMKGHQTMARTLPLGESSARALQILYLLGAGCPPL